MTFELRLFEGLDMFRAFRSTTCTTQHGDESGHGHTKLLQTDSRPAALTLPKQCRIAARGRDGGATSRGMLESQRSVGSSRGQRQDARRVLRASQSD